MSLTVGGGLVLGLAEADPLDAAPFDPPEPEPPFEVASNAITTTNTTMTAPDPINSVRALGRLVTAGGPASGAIQSQYEGPLWAVWEFAGRIRATTRGR
jgi:hypothetical protein